METNYALVELDLSTTASMAELAAINYALINPDSIVCEPHHKTLVMLSLAFAKQRAVSVYDRSKTMSLIQGVRCNLIV